MAKEQYDDSTKQAIAAVAASEYRQSALAALADGSKTPSQVADAAGIDKAHVSRALTDLREVDAAELIVPEETQRGRVHRITEVGESVSGVVLDE